MEARERYTALCQTVQVGRFSDGAGDTKIAETYIITNDQKNVGPGRFALGLRVGLRNHDGYYK